MTRPLVIKIGGGLLEAHGLEGLRRACAEATDAAARQPVLVVPGGGPFADAVRAADQQFGLGDAMAHALALRAMDQLGLLLRGFLPGAQILDRLAVPASLGLVNAAAAFGGLPEVPRTWAVTSDSLAVFAAGAVGAESAVLLKAVPGVDAPPIVTLTADELRALQEAGQGRAVDAFLPEAVRRTGVTVTVRSLDAEGTRITPG